MAKMTDECARSLINRIYKEQPDVLREMVAQFNIAEPSVGELAQLAVDALNELAVAAINGGSFEAAEEATSCVRRLRSCC